VDPKENRDLEGGGISKDQTDAEAHLGSPIRWPVRVKRPGDRRSLSRSATRALDVLELFGQSRRPLRAIEIAKALELHPSTANQLLKTMVESAHLTFEAAGKTYLPSPRLARFSAWMVESYGADEGLRGLVRELREITGGTVTLTTPNDLFMQILDVSGDVPAERITERGLRVSIFGTAIGAAYLSILPDAEVVRLAERGRIASNDLADMLFALRQIRRDGVADGPSMDGAVWSIAAPLPATRAAAPLVLGFVLPAEPAKASLPELRAMLLAAVGRWVERSALEAKT
jgi:DNA-binding IclR family transcriptional regulator